MNRSTSFPGKGAVVKSNDEWEGKCSSQRFPPPLNPLGNTSRRVRYASDVLPRRCADVLQMVFPENVQMCCRCASPKVCRCASRKMCKCALDVLQTCCSKMCICAADVLPENAQVCSRCAPRRCADVLQMAFRKMWLCRFCRLGGTGTQGDLPRATRLVVSPVTRPMP